LNLLPDGVRVPQIARDFLMYEQARDRAKPAK
jgi:hypothetical protein